MTHLVEMNHLNLTWTTSIEVKRRLKTTRWIQGLLNSGQFEHPEHPTRSLTTDKHSMTYIASKFSGSAWEYVTTLVQRR